MASENSESVAVGEVIGYGRMFNPFSKKSRVIVKANGRTIRVTVDDRQKRYIQKVHRIGGRVAVGFYGGEWHVGTPPDHSLDYGPEDDLSDLDLLQFELKGLDLLELAVRPLAAHHKEPSREGEPDDSAGEEVEMLRQRAVMNLLLNEISERRDYIQKVEHNIKKSNDLILETIEKLSDHETQLMLSPEEEPDDPVEDDVETLKQKAVINLLLSEIDGHKDYLKEIEQDIRDNSDAILEDLGLAHLKRDSQIRKLKRRAETEELLTLDVASLEQIKKLNLIIDQNRAIIARLDDISYFLRETIAQR